ADVIWPQTSTTVGTNNAIFAGVDAAAGTYNINVASQIAVSNILVNNNGYVISGSGPLDFSLQGNGGLQVAAGKTATLSCPTVGNNDAVHFLVGAGSVLNIQGAVNNGDEFLGAGTVNLSSSLATLNTVFVDCGDLNFTSGTWTQTAAAGVIYMGFGTSYAGTSSSTGTLTVNGGTLNTGNKIVVCRGGGTGTLILNSGAINVSATDSGSLSPNSILSIPNNDNSANNHANVFVNGGVLTLGNSSYAAPIEMMSGGSSAGETAFLTQTGGMILSYGGIVFGENGGTYVGGTTAVTNSGGFLYLGANGFLFDTGHSATNEITLSGGTVGALVSWSSVMPMTLATLNGNITFQCADNNGNPWNISLSGALTGPGGLNVTGGGILTLSSTNDYAGSTTVSNGTLLLITPSSGAATYGSSLTVDGSAGSPTLSVQSNPGQSVSTGPLTFQNGSTTLDYSFGSLPPSTSVSPVQVSGNIDFAATPTINIGGTAIPVGTYPLITCTGGTISGSVPTSVTITGETASGHIIQTATTISLVITSSSVAGALDSWRVGNGVWDINTTPNWTQNGSQVTYINGTPVIFDDTAAGPFPIYVTNNTVVSPSSVTANNTSGDGYTITGTGSIAGSASVSVLGGGTLALTGKNTYTGGTILSSGQLNINNGGDTSGQDSAIGTGTLTITGGAIDNTSGSNVTLVPQIPENWSNNWTFVGSSSLDIGQGSVSLGQSTVLLNVNSNTFEVDGTINDNGNEFGLTKGGNGALTLMGNNSFFGNFELSSGQLNIGNAGALGFGTCIIDGGSIDNYSGVPLTLNSGSAGSPSGFIWAGSFSYLGTSNSLNLGAGAILVTLPSGLTVNVVSNTLITQGNINAGNILVNKTGLGTWDIAGSGVNSGTLTMTIDQGTVLFDKTTGFVIDNSASGGAGLLIQSNALVFETGIGGPTQPQINPLDPVALSDGGVWDLNGNSETVGDFTNSDGALRNSSASGISGLTNDVSASVIMGTDCDFDVTNSGAVLNIATVLSGSGSLVKTGAGLVDLLDTNTYTGNTTVSGGTLELNAPGLANTSTVTINTNASLSLNFSTTNQIAALFLDGTNLPAGLYSSSTTTQITGSGSLLVVPVAPVGTLSGLQFTAGPVISGTSLTISATNTGSGTVYLLSSTNLTLPISAWTPIWTNVLTGSGSFKTNLLNVVNPAISQEFYLLSTTNN
ncbi:MAG: autotransporter-associated beta strand repeat-containing protein, partial [Verrucomicrobiota bacterium]